MLNRAPLIDFLSTLFFVLKVSNVAESLLDFVYFPKNEGLQVEPRNFLVLGEIIYRNPPIFVGGGITENTPWHHGIGSIKCGLRKGDSTKKVLKDIKFLFFSDFSLCWSREYHISHIYCTHTWHISCIYDAFFLHMLCIYDLLYAVSFQCYLW